MATNKSIKQAAFLAAFSIAGRVKGAAIAAKIDRTSHYYWTKNDPAYPALFAEAKLKAIDAWQDEMVERAMIGVFEPTTYKGAFVYPVIGYEKDPETTKPDANRPIFSQTPYGIWRKSDRLLEFLLKGAKPEVYGDRVEHRGKVAQQQLKVEGTMEELLAIYRDLAAKEANDEREFSA